MKQIPISLLALCALATPVSAQSPRDKVSFADVRFGFTPGPHAGNPDEQNINLRQLLYKPGAWVPVYVHVLNNGKYDERTDGPLGESMKIQGKRLDVRVADQTTVTIAFPAAYAPGAHRLRLSRRAGLDQGSISVPVTALARAYRRVWDAWAGWRLLPAVHGPP